MCFANSLVDRIVSEPIDPVGAIAEPYAIWAIEQTDGLTLPCTHPDIVVTDNLALYERLKLYLLNLGHTFIAEQWLNGNRPKDEIVLEAMNDQTIRNELESLWREEVLPVLPLMVWANRLKSMLLPFASASSTRSSSTALQTSLQITQKRNSAAFTHHCSREGTRPRSGAASPEGGCRLIQSFSSISARSNAL